MTIRILTRISQYLQLHRPFSSKTHQTSPEIAPLYWKLVNRQPNEHFPCNFVTQVLDPWAKITDKTALSYVDLDQKAPPVDITYKNLVARSHQLGQFFLNQGFQKGDTVALILNQHPGWWYLVPGLMRLGIGIVPCSPLLTSKDMRYRINDLGIQGIIASEKLEERIDSIRSECSTLKTTITTGKSHDSWTSLEEILKNTPTTEPSIIHTTTEDPCAYLYTSGTTGNPKAVLHNADYPFCHWPTGKRWARATSEDKFYNAHDPGWGFTLWTTLGAWSMGSQILITPSNYKITTDKILATIRDQGVTIFCAAPTILRSLVANPAFDHTDFPKLRRIITVGEALDEVVIKRFSDRGIEVAVGFGQAETPLIIGRVDDQPHIPNTMGSPVDPYKVDIVDEHFNPVPLGQSGQIAINLETGARLGITPGYINAPEKNKSIRSPDGRYHLTGDWATYSPHGNLYQGRKDDLIKNKDRRISPDEVEKVGMLHPAVAKIAAIGIRTDIDSNQTVLKTFILLRSGYNESPELVTDIQNHYKGITAEFNCPSYIEFLPEEVWTQYETTNGKIRRRELRDRDEAKLN